MRESFMIHMFHEFCNLQCQGDVDIIRRKIGPNLMCPSVSKSTSESLYSGAGLWSLATTEMHGHLGLSTPTAALQLS